MPTRSTIMTESDATRLDAQLHRLHLHYIHSHYQAAAAKAAEQQHSHVDYLAQLIDGEAAMREESQHRATDQERAFPRSQDPRRFPVELAQKDQPTANPEPVPSRFYSNTDQRCADR